jgi:hypothetical protein
MSCKPKFYSKFIRLIRRILNKAAPCLDWKHLFISCDVFSGFVTFDAVFDKWVPDLWCKSLLTRLLTAERFTTRGTPVDSRTYVLWIACWDQNVLLRFLARFLLAERCRFSGAPFFLLQNVSRLLVHVQRPVKKHSGKLQNFVRWTFYYLYTDTYCSM